MKKTFLAILFALISFASAFAAVGDTFTVGGVIYKVTSTDPKEVAVSGYTDEIPADLTLPVEVNGYAVTSIGESAFYDCSNLTSIEIPSSVTSIVDHAFYNCMSLTSIEIPASVTSIGYYTFQSCTSLTSIEIPASVTSIGNYTFANCTSLSSIDIPASVTSIGESAFISCTSLTSIEIPASVTSIGIYTFQSCTSLTSIEIPASVTSISNYTFYNCTSLTSIEIPASVTSIGNYTFYKCTSLTSIEIPASVTSIGKAAFYNCSNLTSISCLGTTPPTATNTTFNNFDKSACTLNVPKGCAEAYKNAENWDGFKAYVEPELAVGDTFTVGGVTYKVTSTDPKEVTVSGYTDDMTATLIIPDMVDEYSVTSIGDNAFENSSNLTSIEIPVSVTSIGDNVFANCTSLTSITCLAATPPTASEDTFGDFDKSACTLNVPIGYTDTYKNAENWDGFKEYIEHITTGIEDVIGDSAPNSKVEVYNLNGVKVADSTDNLRSGPYIIRRNKICKKVLVK